MRGFAQDIEPAYGTPAPFERQVVAVVCASDFPEPGLITDTLRKGQAHDPHTIWVVRDKDKLAVAALEELGLEYLRLSLNPYWKTEVWREVEGGKDSFEPGEEDDELEVEEELERTVDVRRAWREQEMIACSSMIVVFSKPDSATLKPFHEAAKIQSRVKLIVRGKPKARTRKGRKPGGA